MISEFTNIIKAVGNIANMIESLSKNYGFIEKCEIFEFKGRKYKLVWDYIIYNEITMEDIETGKQMQMFTSFSDKKTEDKFNELLLKLSDN